MVIEITIAVKYLLSHLYTKLPRRRVDNFGEELEKYIHTKFKEHWFPTDPFRDAAFRCLNATGPQVDFMLPLAATVSGLDWSEIQTCLPEGLVISVDPGHVACQFHPLPPSNQDINRFSTAQCWPSASLSLSSSGCSSASSSISSTNMTPTTTQMAHQVLYCLSDNRLGCNGSQWNDTIQNGLMKPLRIESEAGTNLATATALSVLDIDEGAASMLNPNATQNNNSLYFSRSLWGNDTNLHNTSGCDQNDVEENNSLSNNNNTMLISQEQSRSEYLTGYNSKLSCTTYPWSEEVADNVLVPTYSDDLNGSSNVEKPYTNLYGRSYSTPHQPYNVAGDYAINPMSVNVSSTHNTLVSPKLDQKLTSTIYGGPVNHRVNPTIFPNSQASLNGTAYPFAPKSVSTPSFTAATFAQTKFGSTKLKNHTKRNTNRIISPTTIQHQLGSGNGLGLMQKDHINSNVQVNNQRILLSNGTDSSAFRRFLPSNIESNPNHCSKPVNLLDQFGPNDNLVANFADLAPTQLSHDSFISIDGKMLSLSENRYANLSDEVGQYIPSDVIDELNHRKSFSVNTVETTCWPLNLIRKLPGQTISPPVTGVYQPSWDNTQSVELTEILTSPNLTRTSIESASFNNLTAVRRSSNLFDRPDAKTDYQTDILPDESFLSARFVNMLLEDDSLNESVSVPNIGENVQNDPVRSEDDILDKTADRDGYAGLNGINASIDPQSNKLTDTTVVG